jgi:hypothetical protein
MADVDIQTALDWRGRMIGKRTRVRGKARLKRYVVTDYVETKVPVRREEVRVGYEPADEGEE